MYFFIILLVEDRQQHSVPFDDILNEVDSMCFVVVVVSQRLTQMVLIPVFALTAVNKSRIWVMGFNSSDTECLKGEYHRPLMQINCMLCGDIILSP